MKKDFDKWNILKKEIDNNKNIPYFREGQICFISMWINIWFEQNWKNDNFSRPVLIIKKFNKDIFLWVSLTTKKRISNYIFYIGEFKNKKNYAILSQLRLYSSKRLLSHIWWVTKNINDELKEKITKLL